METSLTQKKRSGQAAAQDAIFDVAAVRKDFPVLGDLMYGHPLVFLDNAASTQKPQEVIDTLSCYYAHENANIHRGVYRLSEIATGKFENSRKIVQRFINAPSSKEIIFTGGTTDSINLVASSYGRKFIGKGDEIVLSAMEHHSNIVPWQLLAEMNGAKLRVVPIDDDGEIIFDEYLKLLGPRTRLVSMVYISNSLGTVNPIKAVIDAAHQHGIPVLVDGAQAIAHLPVDVQELDCDFFAFSGHKVFGPTGVGVLYGKAALLDAMPPYRGGGDMIRSVTFEKTLYNDLPHKFEAGTPHIAGVIGLGAALEYLMRLGLEDVHRYEAELLSYGVEVLSRIDGLRLIGTPRERSGAISFDINGIHPHDIGTWLDRRGIAIRAGHHCTQPVMEHFGVAGTSRASIALYNLKSDFDQLAAGLEEIIRVFN